jgi:hypothetical protein
MAWKETVITDMKEIYHFSISLEELKNATSQKSYFSDRDSNPGPPNYKAAVVDTTS